MYHRAMSEQQEDRAKAAAPIKWRCLVCGYIHEGDTPPDPCPGCGMGPEVFEQVAEA